jgi:sulfatase maturation enzyme AslB (radical SAM superfamily)
MIKFSAIKEVLKRRSGIRPIEGYVDEISSTGMAGWIRNRSDPQKRVGFRVAIVSAGETRVIAQGRADQFYPALSHLAFGDGKYGFKIQFPAALTLSERENLMVFPEGSKKPLKRAEKFQGYVDERSVHHVAGWVRNRFDPAERVAFEVVVASPGERVVAQGQAGKLHNALTEPLIGDAHYGFRVHFPEPLSEAERGTMMVRPVGAAQALMLSPKLISAPAASLIQGYVDEISSTSVVGWIRDGFNPQARINYDVAIVLPEGTRVIGRGKADQLYPGLSDVAFGDGKYGFRMPIDVKLTARERENLVVRPEGSKMPLERAGAYQGFVNERSVSHVAGWVRNRFNPAERVAFEVVVLDNASERVIGRGVAETFYTALAQQNAEDAFHGFQLIFKTPISEAERDTVIVRPVGAAVPLQLSPRLVERFELLSFVAMDIVNNCNLRCPFCLFDYAETRSTRFMSEETFESALRLIPHVNDAGFWLSCLHEPSLHPDFLRLIERIPRQWRRKVMFTTNLAKRMPDSYYQALAESGVYHINLSLESLTPAVYEKFRKGARWPIFKENWDRLINAWKASAAPPPRLRYITMAYKSNLAEIPALVRFLREERLAWQVEVRHTYEMPHIPEGFAAAEYLDSADWDWLAEQLACYSHEDVLLIPPLMPLEAAASEIVVVEQPEIIHEVAAVTAREAATELTEIIPPAPAAQYPELPLNLQVEWDGELVICGKWDHPSERRLLATSNIKELEEPHDYFVTLSKKPLNEYGPDYVQGPFIQGYVDSISANNVTGWIRDAHAPERRIDFEIVTMIAGETSVIASGCANEFCLSLKDTSIGDGLHGFHVVLPQALTAEQREHLIVRSAECKTELERAPQYQGFVDQRNTRGVAGWVRNRFDADERVVVEIILETSTSDKILGQTIADKYSPGLAGGAVGDACYGFSFAFPQALSEAQRDAVVVRAVGAAEGLELGAAAGPLIQGYVDSISDGSVTGWVRDARDLDLRLDIEVVLMIDKDIRVIAAGQADEAYAALQTGADDGRHGFNVGLSGPLTAEERAQLVIRTAYSKEILPRAPKIQGFVDACSEQHVAGWVRNRFDPQDRLAVEVVVETAAGMQSICQGLADKFSAKLVRDSVGNGCYGFHFTFAKPLTAVELRSLRVLPVDTDTPLAFSPRLVSALALH